MIFLNSASSALALVFYLPGVCTHTDTKGKQRKTRVRNILKSLKKNTIFNEHPVLYSELFRKSKDIRMSQNNYQSVSHNYEKKILTKIK